MNHYASNGDLELMAFAMWLKSFHSNGVFFNYSLRKLSKEVGVSVNYLRKVLPLLEAHGWIVFRDGHMCMKSQSKVAEKLSIDKLTNVTCKVGESWRDVLSELRFLLYGSKASQLRYGWNRRLKKGDTNNAGASELDAIRESLYQDSNTGQQQISYDGLAKVWGCSRTTAFNQMKIWISEGRIVKHKVKVDTGYHKDFYYTLSSMCGSFFLVGDIVYKQLANVYCYA